MREMHVCEHACAIKAIVVLFVHRVRVGDELLGSLVGQAALLEVAACQLDAADHELARHAYWHKPQMDVQHIAPQVCYWAPNRDACAARKLGCDIVACVPGASFTSALLHSAPHNVL